MSRVPILLEGDPTLSWLFAGHQFLVPLKVDITFSGCRLVDSFCWDILSPVSSLEHATKTCQDLNLPEAFRWKYALQVQEQIDAYMTIITALKYRTQALDEKIQTAFSSPHNILVGVRYNALDYSDMISWDVRGPSSITPEVFAKVTCADQYLPAQMGPLIAYKIREHLIRALIACFDDLESSPPLKGDGGVSISPVPVHSAVDLISSLWKHAKPGSVNEQNGIQRSRMPKNKETNATIWVESSDQTNSTLLLSGK